MKLEKASDFLTPQAVRATTAKVFEEAQNGNSYFEMHLENLPKLADYVTQVIRENYPYLKIPYHSRWGHFRAKNPKRLEALFQKWSSLDAFEKARRQIDLVIPSVLLDAGAGAEWKFDEAKAKNARKNLSISVNQLNVGNPEPKLNSSSSNVESDNMLKGVESPDPIGRSEGLGIASFYMFLDGKFSLEKNQDPLRSDAKALLRIQSQDIEEGFQVSPTNPLIGVPGRAGLVRALGEAILSQPKYFVGQRPGGLVDYFKNQFGMKLPAEEILKAILYGLGSIWPGRLVLDGVNLGDVWEHPSQGKIAFHKLSQWLTYSLLEPLESAGFEITQMDQLTGLAEYRNGGLFVDGGVLKLRDESLLEIAHQPGDALIIEWRALTVQLLDKIAPLVREELGFSEKEFPLAKVLEGGTWWAGRKLAQQRSPKSEPPLQILSDGTVF
ncbi:MAG: URC4/urg3 family protein [Bdellovibrionales bacterium]|nr:URC4/urg3 family protein [Bdellovibrionales bacterium]